MRFVGPQVEDWLYSATLAVGNKHFLGDPDKLEDVVSMIYGISDFNKDGALSEVEFERGALRDLVKDLAERREKAEQRKKAKKGRKASRGGRGTKKEEL